MENHEHMKEYIINNKKYRINVFDKLDSESAYLIGYLSGDGGYMQHTHKRKARMSVASSNKSVIDWMTKTYCPDANVYKHLPYNKNRPQIKSNKYSYRFAFSSKMSDAFRKYGILGHKKYRKCVGIPKSLMRSYLKGLIDSDGHFSFGRRKDRNRFWCNFVITHQSIDLLSSVQRFLSNELEISTFCSPRKDEKCLDLKCSKIDSVVKLIYWLLEDESCPFFKKNVAIRLLSTKGSMRQMPPKRVKTGNSQEGQSVTTLDESGRSNQEGSETSV